MSKVKKQLQEIAAERYPDKLYTEYKFCGSVCLFERTEQPDVFHVYAGKNEYVGMVNIRLRVFFNPHLTKEFTVNKADIVELDENRNPVESKWQKRLRRKAEIEAEKKKAKYLKTSKT